MPQVITFGETMVLLSPLKAGSLQEAHLYERSFGGAESNVAIGLARLGIEAGWFSRLGK
ncbi:PfkB family carbohydrate kinase [Laceyella putida]|uniref:PfkB family carbohydrate kinase n=1 Tax=Laceyella putida TaxID=110101 RepID=A0ABW2RLZ0_9BACL